MHPLLLYPQTERDLALKVGTTEECPGHSISSLGTTPTFPSLANGSVNLEGTEANQSFLPLRL